MKTNTATSIALMLCIIFSSSIAAQQDTLEIQLDVSQIRSQIVSAPNYFNSPDKKSTSQISIPTLSGEDATFSVFETVNMEEPLYSNFPEIRSYILVDINDPKRKGRLSTSPDHVNIMIKKSGQYEYITPLRNSKDYQLYKGTFDRTNIVCGVDELAANNHEEELNRNAQTSFSNGTSLRTYRMAIATTGEFYIAQGNTDATVLAKINSYLNLLNDIYENELAVHFDLIGNNTDILFTDSSTDGLDPASGTSQLSTSQTVINNTIGAANYDIGHTFYTPSGTCCFGSGIAQLGILCNDNNKARGWTGASALSSDALWMGLFAHEVGHQFGAFHTMYGTESNCDQRTAGNGYEPGSGNSLMSYEGICDLHNITPEVSTIYFHNHSLDQMLTVMNGTSCPSTTLTGNAIPVTTTPANKTIPIGTPFELTGSASDADGDAIYYCWEEFDTDNITYASGAAAGAPNAAASSTTAPLFRSFDPSLDGATRTFPTISDIINNTQTQGEILPNVSRNMNFRLTSRDFNANGGAVSFAEVDLTVDASMGPFNVSSQSTATTWTANGSNTATVTWDVAGTNTLCTNVDILFSIDRGLTFPFTLANSTSNDGSHTLTIPSLPTSVGRIKVKCSDNYFFDINLGDITLESTCDAVNTTFSPDTDVAAIEGSSALNLSLAPEFGASIGTINGILETTDPASTLIGNGSPCDQFGNTTNYDEYRFQVDASSVYTFTKSSGSNSIVMSLYEGDFSASSPCNNLILSAFTNGTSPASSISSSLLPGVEYTLIAGSFSATSPTLPASYTITHTGNIYDGIPPPGSAFSYTYVAVNSTTGLIAAISSTSDFTTLSDGNFSVYGLSYETSNNLNTYIGSSFSSLQTDVFNLVICGGFSLNDILLTIESSSNCPPDYAGGNALSGTESGTQDYESDGAIESTQIISASATVDYDSGTSIKLEAPFNVQLGATFNAFIDGCGGALQTTNTEEK